MRPARPILIPGADAAPDLGFLGTGLCGTLLARLDGAGCAAGPPCCWPPALRAALAVALRSPAATAILWGPEGVLFYNDAFAPLLGPDHPGWLGGRIGTAPTGFATRLASLLVQGLAGRPGSLPAVLLFGDPSAPTLVDLDASPLPGDDGQAAGAVVFATPAPARRDAAEPTWDRLEPALDAAGILGTIFADFRSGLLTADQRFARNFGLDPGACLSGLLPAAVRAVIHPEDRHAAFVACTEAVGRGGAFAHRLRLRRPDGSYLWAEVAGRVERNAAGRPLRALGAFQDVGPQVAAEEARHAAEAIAAEASADLRAIFDTVPTVILIARDREARQIDGNRASRELLRLPAQGANLSKSATDGAGPLLSHFRVLTPEGRELLPAELPVQRAARGETLRDFEERLVFDDGVEFWLRGNAVPLLGPDGQPRGAVAAFQDVTPRKRAEAALATRERTLSAVIEALPECVKLCTLDGRLLSMNAAGLALLELDDVAPLLGQDPGQLVDEGDRRAYAHAQAGAAQGQPSGWIEFGVTGFKGRRRRMQGRATPILGIDGAPEKVLWTTRDVTEARAAEATLRESEARFRNMADHSPAIMWVTDPEGRCTYLNSKWYEITGQAEALIPDHGWLVAVHPEDQAEVMRVLFGAQACKEAFRIEYRVKDAEGGWRWMIDTAAPRWGAGGAFLGFVGSMFEITDSKAAEAALRESEARFRNMADHAPVMMWVNDPEGRCTYVNRPWTDFTGQTEEEALDQGWLAALHPGDRARMAEVVADAHRRGVPFRADYRLRRADGTWRWCLDAATPRRDTTGALLGFVGSVLDITDRKAAEEAVQGARIAAEFAATHDSLTGLLSREGFRRRLDRELAADGEEPLALVLIDLDEFKSVNDAFGHPAGDALLIEAAQRLRRSAGEGCMLGRLGGDEFVVLAPASAGPMEILAQALIARLSESYLVAGQEVTVGASAGVAMADQPGLLADDLLKRADIALYRAKEAGRGVLRFFEPGLEAAAEERQRLRTELREALPRGELLLLYQPIVELGTGRTLGFEALLRWRHPRRGLLAPLEFVPLAEATSEIERLGAWVLEEACREAATWPGDLRVSVNLSARQVRSGHLAAVVRSALAGSGLVPDRLQVEITESLLLQDAEEVGAALGELRLMGLRLSIDDFGTGYSSLGYLRRFAVDNIKIDRSFVTGLRDDPRSAAILRAVVSLAKELGVSLTAEGIETPVQAEQLFALGCREGQGFLFARPLPPCGLGAFLSDAAAEGRGRAGPRALP